MEETCGYRMGGSGEWDTKRSHSLLIDDTKTFKESQKKKLEIANDIIVKASQDTGGSFHIKVRQERDFYNYPLRSS